MSDASAVLVANPAAGLGRTRRIAARLAQALAERGLDLQLLLTPSSAAAAAAVRNAISAGCRRVIVAGGDGTINSVIGALAYSPAALGIIPTGMANAFARELALPLAWRSACNIAAGSHRRVIDIGRAGDRHFALMAGVGFDAEAVARVDPRLKRWLGPAAYVLAGLRHIPMRANVHLQWETGEAGPPGRATLRALMIVAANAAHYTYRWRLAPRARVDDGLLDIVVFGWQQPFDPAAHVMGALAGTHLRHPRVTAFRARRLRIDSQPALAYQLDGDAAGVTPVEVEILPGALTVLAPPAS